MEKCKECHGGILDIEYDGSEYNIVYCPMCHGSGSIAEEHEKLVPNKKVIELQYKIDTLECQLDESKKREQALEYEISRYRKFLKTNYLYEKFMGW